MAKLISKCPGCKGALIISTLQCSCCGMELKSNFDLSPFDQLNSEQNALLMRHYLLTKKSHIAKRF